MARQFRSRSGTICNLAVLVLCCSVFWSSPSQDASVKAPETGDSAASFREIIADNSMLATIAMLICCTILASSEQSKGQSAGAVEARPDLNSFFISNLLCFAAGIVNALAFMHMHMTVSHQSGNTTHTGRLLGHTGFHYGRLLLAFGSGGFVSGFFNVDGESIYHGRYSPLLLSAALATVFGCVICYCKAGTGHEHDETSEALVLWAFGQGIQNAITRKCSSLPVCTTHFTGYWTDFGLGLGAYVRAIVSQEKLPSLIRTVLFGAGILSFLVGGYFAAQIYGTYGPQGALISASLMTLVALGLVPTASRAKAQ
jgi:uncharacterized membrane protein YoaK (UPF0700 family)